MYSPDPKSGGIYLTTSRVTFFYCAHTKCNAKVMFPSVSVLLLTGRGDNQPKSAYARRGGGVLSPKVLMPGGGGGVLSQKMLMLGGRWAQPKSAHA